MNTNCELTGYIIIDGKGYLIGVKIQNDIQSIKHVLHKCIVDLPRTMGRGAASYRMRLMDKKKQYLINAAEKIFNTFIINEKVNVNRIIVAGPGNMKDELIDFLDKRIRDTIVDVVNTSYGMDCGFSMVSK